MISLYILRKHIVTKTAGSKTINKDPFNNSLEFHFKTASKRPLTLGSLF